MCVVHKNERSAHAQKQAYYSYEVKNSCFLVDWSCRLPFREDSREDYELCDSLVVNLGKCGNQQARYWGGGGGSLLFCVGHTMECVWCREAWWKLATLLSAV